MEDSDDDLLEDIKLLEYALSYRSSSAPPSPSPRGSPQAIPNKLPTGNPQEELLHEAFQLNASLIAKYTLLKTQILSRLQEIQQEREETAASLKLVAKGTKGSRVHYKRVGFPYFKDEQMFPAPLNEDALLKVMQFITVL